MTSTPHRPTPPNIPGGPVRNRRDTGQDGWIRQYHPPRGGGPVLVCCPHAGGSAVAYHSLSAALSATTEVLITQYPGRQDRLLEPPVESIAEMADSVVAALTPWRHRPIALFGHSMGSVLAYEIALRLERLWPGNPPIGVIGSGRSAPSVRHDRGLHLLGDEGIVATMADLAGTPTALLDDKDLLAVVIPAMRSDFKAAETYQDTGGTRLDCPISAYCGESDVNVPAEGVLAWGEHTTAGFTSRFFPGGHFYIQSGEREVARAISRDVAAFTAARAAARKR
ncbi:thioesterase [Streptomyces sp. BH-SS-21]|uniref:Thioesterase n=1 Tax=Streptomyces liliiviolaceus TaxID=2823109 RepID=A0A940Y1F4_9ACTN|nr:alpha/beta fold hydrolase [Streptomyces liliiviolaceus]MBQ0853733.1 thioesterase [Streptomyces liliiviolaceus]